jgi:hypothetical protein
VNLGATGPYGEISTAGSGSAGIRLSAIRRQADIVAVERELTAVYGAEAKKHGVEAEKQPKCRWLLHGSFGRAPNERRVSAGLRQMLAVVFPCRSATKGQAR